MNRKVIISLNTSWNLFNFRSGLIKALIENHYEVIAVAPRDKYAQRVIEMGCRFEALPMDNKGTNPLRDILLLWRFWRVLFRERPAVYLGYTVKPNVYGSIAAQTLGIPVINNISGLGTVFINQNFLTWLVQRLYRFSLSGSAKAFFHNADDRQLFIESGLVRFEITDCLPGSGVDLKKFLVCPLPNNVNNIRFIFIGRMLLDKGISEFVEAARLVKKKYFNVEFCLVGPLDVQNQTAISREKIFEWSTEGVVNYLGATDDIGQFITHADCVVLPSYREGTPRTLLEAAAMGRPIIATNVVGCREVVDDGINGYLCRPRSSLDLAEKMEWMIDLSPNKRKEMGKKGREKMEREFDENIVIRKYLNAIEEVTNTVV